MRQVRQLLTVHPFAPFADHNAVAHKNQTVEEIERDESRSLDLVGRACISVGSIHHNNVVSESILLNAVLRFRESVFTSSWTRVSIWLMAAVETLS